MHARTHRQRQSPRTSRGRGTLDEAKEEGKAEAKAQPKAQAKAEAKKEQSLDENNLRCIDKHAHISQPWAWNKLQKHQLCLFVVDFVGFDCLFLFIIILDKPLFAGIQLGQSQTIQ
jgi:hypothetical protein